MLVNVSIALIYNTQNQLLISRRAKGLYKAGYWEFPGGKVEANETPEAALIRELEEEIAITPIQFETFTQYDYVYDEMSVRLHVFKVSQYKGEPVSQLQQVLKWIALEELNQYQFPEANVDLINLL